MMDSRRFAELIELLIDGELSQAEATELRVHAQSDPAAVAALRAATQEHMLCRTALRPADAALLAERTRRMLESWRPASGEVAAKRIFSRIDQRRRKASWRWWGGLAAAMLAATVGLSLIGPGGSGPSAAADGEAPRVTARSGDVRQAGGVQVAVDHVVAVGEALEVGSGANATLAWRDGTSMRISSDSHLVRLPGAGQRVQLERGTVTVQAAHRPSSAPLEIVCPDAITRVVGTAFVITVTNGRSHLTVSDGVVRLTRSADGATSLVGAGQQVAAAVLPLPAPLLMTPEHLAALRAAISTGREPWTGSYAALRQRATTWSTPSATLPAVVEVAAYNGGNSAHSAARVTIGNATQPALGLALIARIDNDALAANTAVQHLLAWLPVRVEGVEADIVACDTTIALVQAADLLRGTPAWTTRAEMALDTWIQRDLAPRAARLQTDANPQARWRGTAAAMTIAAWHGDQAGVRALMATLRREIAAHFTPTALARLLPGTGDDRQLLQDLIFALQCADLARIAADDTAPPPPEWNTAVTAFLARYAQAQPVDSEKTFFMRALVGPGPWRTPAAQRFVVGPDPARQVAFGWFFPTLLARDPRW